MRFQRGYELFDFCRSGGIVQQQAPDRTFNRSRMYTGTQSDRYQGLN